MATVLSNPATGLGGPGTCRAKWLALTPDDDNPFSDTITNASIVAAFNDPDVPPELTAAISAVYGSQSAALNATTFGMRFDLHLLPTDSAPTGRTWTANIDIDGNSKIEINIDAVGGNGISLAVVELVFNHSETR